jgi:hypothetical protein
MNLDDKITFLKEEAHYVWILACKAGKVKGWIRKRVFSQSIHKNQNETFLCMPGYIHEIL